MMFETMVIDLGILLSVLIPLLMMITVFLIITILEIVSNKIHKSYHKGYNDAKTQEHRYYKTIKEIIDKYAILFDSLQNSETTIKVYVLEGFIDFKNYLSDLQK